MEASEAHERRRALGAYYTPEDIARTLTAWALSSNIGPVLDPSYGICRFLNAAVEVLSTAGVPRPQRSIHGIDIDEVATTNTTRALIARGARPDQFVHRDFFQVRPEPRFAAVLGNPPYVRHHWQDEAVKATVSMAMREAGVKLSRQASLWAPFVIHADRFVRTGGRMAMLLPGAAIQARYADAVWEHLRGRYSTVTLVRIGERLFPDALEETVVVLADGRGRRGGRVPIAVEVASFAELAHELNGNPSPEVLRRRGHQLGLTRSDLTTRRLVNLATSHHATCRISDVADIRLGTVTGANSFFVRPSDDELLRRLPTDEVGRVVPGSGALRGAVWTDRDDLTCAGRGARCRVLWLRPDRRLEGRLADAVTAAEEAQIHLRSHCRRRNKWWSIERQDAPHAFLAYMATTSKGIVVNRAAANCLNGVHQVVWRVPDAEKFVLSTWTSLWALVVEQTARHYAGGVLKLEPGTVRDLPIVKHENLSAIGELDRHLREGSVAAARKYADECVLHETLGFSKRQIRTLRASVQHLEQRRSPRVRVARS